MTFLLDTNICIAFLNHDDARVKERLRDLRPEDVELCSVVKAELLYGARKSARVAENLRRVESFCRIFASRPFDDGAAEHYAVLRLQLQRDGTPIGANDMLIAAIALAADCTLVTRNVREFARVAGLRVDSW